ncbi:MAG TPA: preprotein translocase subunit SecE [Planctomycetes bacterium]|nr:preprotein translocase subunit SecE [Planctomycetota bacterium]|tara:strand:- start:167 stop:607 length:441 start_codon:yes stop_codon:yes gene_type:complete
MLYSYKPDDGRNARQATFWLGELFLFFGCTSLNGSLGSFESLRGAWFESFPMVPILGATLSGAFLIAAFVFVAGSLIWMSFLGREKIAEHLIEVEGEMKKVTWPSFKEASNASVVVVATVLIIMAFLALSDLALGKFFQRVLWGGA